MRFGYEDDLASGHFSRAEQKLNVILCDLDQLTLSPGEVALLYNDRGQAKYLQVRFTEAIADYDLAINLNSNLGLIHYNRSTVVYRMGDYAAALPGFQRALDLSPENVEFNDALQSCRASL